MTSIPAAPLVSPAAPPVAPAPPVAATPPPAQPLPPPALLPPALPPPAQPVSAGPRVELTFRDGSSASLDAVQARALEEIAQVLTRRDEVKH